MNIFESQGVVNDVKFLGDEIIQKIINKNDKLFNSNPSIEEKEFVLNGFEKLPFWLDHNFKVYCKTYFLNNTKDFKKQLEDKIKQWGYFDKTEAKLETNITSTNDIITYSDSLSNVNLFIVSIFSKDTKQTKQQPLIKVLFHELTHAYEYYCQLLNNAKSKYKEETYDDICELINNNDPIIQTLGYILYNLHPIERSAMINEFYYGYRDELKKNLNLRPQTYIQNNDVINLLKEIYRGIFEKNFFEKHKTKLEPYNKLIKAVFKKDLKDLNGLKTQIKKTIVSFINKCYKTITLGAMNEEQLIDFVIYGKRYPLGKYINPREESKQLFNLFFN